MSVRLPRGLPCLRIRSQHRFLFPYTSCTKGSYLWRCFGVQFWCFSLGWRGARNLAVTTSTTPRRPEEQRFFSYPDEGNRNAAVTPEVVVHWLRSQAAGWGDRKEPDGFSVPRCPLPALSFL
jgi:hypothetical protein